MAEKTVRVCDVFGTVVGVTEYTVTVQPSDNDADGNEAPAAVFRLLDLSPRALKRLLKFIGRGCTSPTRKASKED